MTAQNQETFYWYIAKVALLYVLIMLLAFSIKDNVELTDIVAIGKIFSLCVLLVVNGEIANEVDKSQTDIKAANYTILAAVIVIIVFAFVKLLGLEIERSNAANWVKVVLQAICNNISWMSAFPLVAYAVLDYYIAYVRRGTDREKATAQRFFIFVDLTCIYPLVLVYSLTAVCSTRLASPSASIELFTSGSMAIVLLSSAIAAKAVEECFGNSTSTEREART